jgi:hypothetical protein
MNSISKRIIALFAVMAISFSFAVPSFAATPSWFQALTDGAYGAWHDTSFLGQAWTALRKWNNSTTGSPSTSISNTGCNNNYVYNICLMA